MLDHAFVQAIAAMRDVLDDALLQRRPDTESYQLDLRSGDTTWETSYVLPGDLPDPHVVAVIEFEWSSWSQTTQANLDNDVPDDDVPDIGVEITFRLRRLKEQPDLAVVEAALPADAPVGLPFPLRRKAPYFFHRVVDGVPSYGLDVDYAGDFDLARDAKPRDGLGPLGPWIAGTLVRLADLPLESLPAEED